MALKDWFLECRPSRRLRWEESEDGHVIVYRPRFGESRLGLRLAAWLGLSDYRIRLDEIGTRVWRECDGRRTAAEIAETLRGCFGSRIEPAEERLQTFVFQMSRARMISIRTAGRERGAVEDRGRS